MKAKKVLFITSEMVPFVSESHRSYMGRYIPQRIQEAGREIRTFTPKWGNINERRNQLHEVIRLSGMNLIIDETDHPLIIKVASLSQARMQIYFIDNDDYFMKRQIITDEDGNEYDDNGERAIFYARGVLETVKKLRWIPDVIHCHGWIAALAPLYIKHAFQNEPSFVDTKVVCSVSSEEFKSQIDNRIKGCIPFKGVTLEDIEDICSERFGHAELMKIAVKFSDGVILDDENVDPSVLEYIKSSGKSMLEVQPKDDFRDAYAAFYDSLM